MKRTSYVLLAALSVAAAVCPAIAQDAAAPFRRSLPSPTPAEENAAAAEPAPVAEKSPETSLETRAAAPSPAQPPSAVPSVKKSEHRARKSSRSILREEPVRAVERRAAVTRRRRPWDDPPQTGLGTRPTWDIALLGGGSVSTTIRRLEKSWQAAIRAHDALVISELIADDFVGTSLTGRTASRSGLLREIRRDKNVYKMAEARGMTVRMKSDKIAVVTGVARESGTTSAGKRFMSSLRFTDTWVKRSGKWRCTASQATQLPAR